ncbi:MAG: class I SAM-dependent methyltransferase [Patescibacteria group bacterium]
MKSTDWSKYYQKPYKTAKYSRSITGNILIKYIEKYVDLTKKITIAELGGANSCFYELVRKKIKPLEYHVIDNNQIGLDKFKERVKKNERVFLSNQDVLNINSNIKVDLVFSTGLIEHFSIEGTKKAIEAHFKILKPNGIAIITFPTPTFLYKITRWFSKILGLWIFHDERPLSFAEVIPSLEKSGMILEKKINWLIFLTQGVVVIKNNCKK